MLMDSKEKNNSKQVNIWKNTQFLKSFHHAWDGVKTIWCEERNLRHHVALGSIPLLAGVLLGISRVEWIVIVLCVFLVIIMEFLNTIIETVVDMVTNYEYHPLAKKAKDIAAGAVLVTAFFTVVIAAIIFLPKLIELAF
ncbi:diacylglycerol kinase [Jeotgalibaca sp. A127]|uniref:diacylglycerol kinase n=1 Tax=Jeotgalibaca sp. A127 TaxID=3457324 RepID=UPI003FD427F1